MRFADFGFTDYISINSPWFNNEGNFYTQTGSYYFDNEWERIDSIFTLGKIQVADFNAVIKNPWASAKGIPMSYKIYSGEGYSDHLPIMAKLILTN